MAAPKTEDAKAAPAKSGALSPTYDKVVADKAVLDATIGDGPKPDMPYTRGTTGYGDEGHVNPAIEPAAPWNPEPRPDPVPVINDPGLLAASINLADLNKAAMDSYGVETGDPTSGITEEGQNEAIKEAAVTRLRNLEKERAEVARNARRRVG